MTRRTLIYGSALGAAIVVLGVAQHVVSLSAEGQQTVQAPRFEVDPVWPKPLPNHWVLGNVIGIGIDANDHVFIVHRVDTVIEDENGSAGPNPASECCVAAPPVIEFDPEGNVVKAWGGPMAGAPYVWPSSNHGIIIDDKNNVWIGGNGTNDSHILKFTHDGKFLAQYGAPNKVPLPMRPGYSQGDSKSREHFGRVAKVSFDLKAREAFVADGYLNKRVAVLDMETGAFKRIWGAYGNEPSDTNYGNYNPDAPLIPQFRTPVHCAEPSLDGFVYVCDRPNDRLQVFEKSGKFAKEVRIAPRTLGDGSTWDIAFSKDAEQKYMFLADGKNEKIYVIDRLAFKNAPGPMVDADKIILTEFGDGGRQPGQWFAVHSIANDSKGNLYTTETYEGKRIQKFVYKGIQPVQKVQGVVWPKK